MGAATIAAGAGQEGLCLGRNELGRGQVWWGRGQGVVGVVMVWWERGQGRGRGSKGLTCPLAGLSPGVKSGARSAQKNTRKWKAALS